jgi:hypothetical protein
MNKCLFLRDKKSVGLYLHVDKGIQFSRLEM